MFEVVNRVATARSGSITEGDSQIQTPCIRFLDTERFPAPEHAETTTGLMIEEMHILHKSIELYQNPKIFLDEFIKSRIEAGFQKPLFLPGLAVPNNLAMLVYLGADLLDSSRTALLSSEGYFMTPDGAWPVGEISQNECRCAGCSESLYMHNTMELQAELERVRRHIANGTLREFVEYRAKTSPRLVEMLRLFDSQHFAFQEERSPVTGSNFRAITRLSLNRPDIERFRRRVIERYRKPAVPQILVLLPCSARKPYSESSSHYFFRNAIRNSGKALNVHEVIVTSPMGVVPRELEMYYPAQNYDIPVTGHWFEDEKHMINKLLNKYLEINKYSHIINHTGEDFLDIDSIQTTEGAPRSDASLKLLQGTLADFSVGGGGTWGERSIQEICSMAMFQFGAGAGSMFEGCVVKGRWPQVRIFRGKEQAASLNPQTGMLIPTLEGCQFLIDTDIHVVKIADFQITGNVFAVGVESASPEIRPGDEVAVVRNGELAACGTARMSGLEMVGSSRGEAVRVRHRAK